MTPRRTDRRGSGPAGPDLTGPDRGATFYQGTRADLRPGDPLTAGRTSHCGARTPMAWIYFSATLDAAIWGCELAAGEARERIHIVEPTGDWFDDPNPTDRKFPDDPTRSYAPIATAGSRKGIQPMPRRTTTPLRTVAFCAIPLALASALPAAAQQQPGLPPGAVDMPKGYAGAARAGDLVVVQFWVDPKKTPIAGPQRPPIELHRIARAERGVPLRQLITFSGCRADAAGACHLGARVAITLPDGQPYGEPAEMPLWDGPAPPRGHSVMAPEGVVLTFEEGDALGRYRIELGVTDRVAGVTATSTSIVEARPAPPPPPGTSPEVAELTAFADAFDNAQLLKHGDRLAAMIADDLVYIDGEGAVHGKRDFIADWMRPDEQYDPLELKDRVIVPLGKDGGLASAEAILSGGRAGKPFRIRLRYTDVFRRTGTGWQVAHIQVTRLPLTEEGGAAAD